MKRIEVNSVCATYPLPYRDAGGLKGWCFMARFGDGNWLGSNKVAKRALAPLKPRWSSGGADSDVYTLNLGGDLRLLAEIAVDPNGVITIKPIPTDGLVTSGKKSKTRMLV